MAEPETIHDRLQWVYEHSGAENLGAFADAVKVNRSAMWRLLNGDTAPALGTLIAVCERYQYSLHWLVTGRGPVTPPEMEDQEIFEKGRVAGWNEAVDVLRMARQVFSAAGAGTDELARWLKRASDQREPGEANQGERPA